MNASDGQAAIAVSDAVDEAACKCSRPDAPRVTLVDGRECCTWCEEWRHECEARHITNMKPLQARRDYLYGKPNQWNKLAGGIKQRRGDAALKRLEETMSALWERRVAEAKAQVLGRNTPANDNEGANNGTAEAA